MDKDIRKELAAIVGSIDDENEEEKEPNVSISMSAVDVTGSLGVWGDSTLICHYL